MASIQGFQVGTTPESITEQGKRVAEQAEQLAKDLKDIEDKKTKDAEDAAEKRAQFLKDLNKSVTDALPVSYTHLTDFHS